MRKVEEYLAFTSTSNRKFGVELEINSFDGKSKPDGGGPVKGMDYVCNLISGNTTEGAEVRGWENTNNNSRWVVKPDSSCGMEICTPPLIGWNGLEKLLKVVEALSNDSKIKSDGRCSVHVHVDFSDLTEDQIAQVLMWYIKCEPVIMDAVPECRKRNRYCQFIGMTTQFSHEERYTAQDIINRMGDVKYYSMHSKALRKGSERRTVEFRVMEGEGCRNAYLIKNWIRFLLHFVDMALRKPIIHEYIPGNQWSHLCWLDPEDVFTLLGFNDGCGYDLSRGLQQTRNWFIARLQKHMSKDVTGPRHIAYKQLCNIVDRLAAKGIVINTEEQLCPKDIKTALYNDDDRL